MLVTVLLADQHEQLIESVGVFSNSFRHVFFRKRDLLLRMSTTQTCYIVHYPLQPSEVPCPFCFYLYIQISATHVPLGKVVGALLFDNSHLVFQLLQRFVHNDLVEFLKVDDLSELLHHHAVGGVVHLVDLAFEEASVFDEHDVLLASLAHLLLLNGLLLLELLNALRESHCARLLEDETLREVGRDDPVDSVLNLTEFYWNNHIQFVDLLLFCKLQENSRHKYSSQVYIKPKKYIKKSLV